MPCTAGQSKHVLCKPGCIADCCKPVLAFNCREICCKERLANQLNTEVTIGAVRASICAALVNADDLASICTNISSGNVISAYCKVDIILRSSTGVDTLYTTVQHGVCVPEAPTNPAVPGDYTLYLDDVLCDGVTITV